MKEKLREERGKDTVGIPKAKKSSMGSSRGAAKNLSKGGSTKGVGGKLSSDTTKEEPLYHTSAYRRMYSPFDEEQKSGDKNFNRKPEQGLPRQEAAYMSRDRQGTGIEHQPKWQEKEKSYPKTGTKKYTTRYKAENL